MTAPRSCLLLPLVALLAACAPTGQARGGSTAQATAAGSPVGRPLPDVMVAALDGTAASVGAAIAGRPALVVLWATWCEACVEEIPSLRRLWPRARAEGAALVSVSVGEPREKVAEFVARNSRDPGSAIAWPQLVDERFRFADAAGQSRVPATLVVSAEGVVVWAGDKLDEGTLAALSAEIARAHEK